MNFRILDTVHFKNEPKLNCKDFELKLVINNDSL